MLGSQIVEREREKVLEEREKAENEEEDGSGLDLLT